MKKIAFLLLAPAVLAAQEPSLNFEVKFLRILMSSTGQYGLACPDAATKARLEGVGLNVAPTFKLGCVPAVNLFPLAADPIPLAGARPPLPGSPGWPAGGRTSGGRREVDARPGHRESGPLCRHAGPEHGLIPADDGDSRDNPIMGNVDA